MNEFFDIDRNKLDEEWINHPRNYHQHAKELADAKDAVERASSKLEVVVAEIDRDIRANPQDFGFEKITETAIKSCVFLQPRYQKAHDEYLNAKHSADIAEAAVKTMEHKKKALEKAVDLFLAGYWAIPKASVDNREVMDEMQKKAIRSKGRK